MPLGFMNIEVNHNVTVRIQLSPAEVEAVVDLVETLVERLVDTLGDTNAKD